MFGWDVVRAAGWACVVVAVIVATDAFAGAGLRAFVRGDGYALGYALGQAFVALLISPLLWGGLLVVWVSERAARS